MAPKTCCFCCPLRCGTITIGALFLIVHGLETIGLITTVIFVAEEADDSYHNSDYETALTSSCVALGFIGTWFILDILLLRGLATDRRCFVLAWLCWALPLNVLAVLGASVSVCLVAVYADEKALVAVPAVVLVGYLFNTYWAIVVLIYYQSMGKTAQTAARWAQVAPILAYGQMAMPATMVAPQPAMAAIAPSYQQSTYHNPMANYPRRHDPRDQDDYPPPMRRY